MRVRSTNIASALGFLLNGWLGAALLILIFISISGENHLASGQEAKRSPEAAKARADAKLIAQGKYIVEGVAGCGYCHTPRDKNGDPDRTKWLAGAPVFYEPAQPIPGWPVTAPRLAGLPPGSDEQIITLLTTAISRDGTPARAPMPRFHMTKADAEAVLAYLKSLPSP